MGSKMWRSEINQAVVALVDPRVGERVVDVGAGMGAGTVAAARTEADVIAVEPTPFRHRVLGVRRWFQRARRHIRIVDASAEHLPLDDGSADAIWAVNTTHHWVDASTRRLAGRPTIAITGRAPTRGEPS